MTRISTIRRPDRRPKLAIEQLEAREVPAHNLTIVAGTTDTNILIGPGNGSTITIFTKGDDAQLSIGTLETQLQDANTQHLIVTTDVKNGQPGTQTGNIVWDAGTAGSLNFSGFGTGKTLTFQTVDGTNADGTITLTGVQFQSLGDQISLEFDSHLVDGNITFQSGATGTVELHTTAVNHFSVNAGTGIFSYTDAGNPTPADISGSFTVTAGPVTLTLIDGITAEQNVSVTAGGNLTLSAGTSLSANDDLILTATGSASASMATLASGGDIALSVSGTGVSLNQIAFTAPTGLSVTGTTSVSITNGTFDVGGPVTFTGGTVNLSNVNLPSFLQTVGDVTVSGTNVTLNHVSIDSSRDISVTGTSINANNVVALQAGRNLSVSGPIVTTLFFDAEAIGSASFAGSIDGSADVAVSAGSTLTFGENIGAITPLTSLILLRGDMELGAHNLNAGEVTVGQNFDPVEATLGMNGTLMGTVNVQPTGNLAPGGLGTVGTMNVTGSVSFDGGDFAVDFGAGGTADKLLASGNVTINAGSELGGGLGTGQLTGGLAIVIDAGTAVNGTFENAPPGVPVLVGTDAVTATYTPDRVILTPFVPVGGATAVAAGVDTDGTGFKATLTGGGQVLTGTDWLGQQFLVVRNSTAASRLTVTTTANASSGVVEFPGGVVVSGPLAGFAAPTVNIGTQFRVAGPVTSATFRDFLNSDGATGIDFGGTAANLTTITARNVFGSVKVGSTLTSLKVARALGASAGVPFPQATIVSAAAIGKVTALSALADFTTPGAIGTILIAKDILGNLTAKSLASLTARSMNGDVTTTGAVTSLKTTEGFVGKITAGSVAKFQSGGGFANIQSTGAVGSITGKGETPLELELSASTVGTIKVDGTLSGDGIWNVTGGITSLTAGKIADVDVQAKFIGSISVKGNTTFGLSGDIVDSTFTLTGNNGTGSALTTLTAKGNVIGTRFDVQDGNVGAVTVGRFHGSQLYLNYTPGADFTLGSFGTKKHTLTSFKTTAVPTIDPNHPLEWAFKDSEIAADTIGTVTLSGLKTDNDGTAFGIKAQTAVTSVIVVKADVTNDPDLPLGVALTPDKTPPFTALAGDFFFMNV